MTLRVAIFTESWMVRRADGGIYALRDTFPRFASHFVEQDVHVTLVARTLEESPECNVPAPDLLPLGDKLRFLPTPFFHNAIDAYRRWPALLRASEPIFAEAMDGADLALFRVRHHAVAKLARMAKARDLPFGLWWAAQVLANIEQNFRAASLKGQLARMAGRAEEAMLRRLARHAAVNFIQDRPMFELAGQPANTHWIVPNLASRHHFVAVPAPRKAEGFTFVYAGRIVRHKGIFDMLDAFGALAAKDPSLRLKVAGSGPDSASFAEAVARHPQADQIELLGQVNMGAVRALLRDGEVFLLPSYAEGTPKVMWEVWGAGTPMVIADVGGVSHFARDGENALIMKPGDVAGLRAAMAHFVEDEELRLRLAGAGLALARHHSMEDEIERLHGAFSAAADRREVPVTLPEVHGGVVAHGDGAR